MFRQLMTLVFLPATMLCFATACNDDDIDNNLRNTLVAKGYSAQVAQNPETGMYRVIASSFDDRASAIQSRDQLRGFWPDAWLLYRTY